MMKSFALSLTQTGRTKVKNFSHFLQAMMKNMLLINGQNKAFDAAAGYNTNKKEERRKFTIVE